MQADESYRLSINSDDIAKIKNVEVSSFDGNSSPSNFGSSRRLNYEMKDDFENDSFRPCECPKVLGVDDEPFNLLAVEGFMEQLGILKIEKAFNGEEALRKIHANS